MKSIRKSTPFSPSQSSEIWNFIADAESVSGDDSNPDPKFLAAARTIQLLFCVSGPLTTGSSAADGQVLIGVHLLGRGNITAFARYPHRNSGGDTTKQANQVVPTHHPRERHTKDHASDHADVIHAFTIAHSHPQSDELHFRRRSNIRVLPPVGK